jgi:CubicO group peptidase (beta-lactamase class C family)
LNRALHGILLAVFVGVAFSANAVEVTGRAVPGLEPFDTAMLALLEKWRIPGASLAVAREGRIMLLRGYGLADRDTKEPVDPASLFRIGSLNKTMTAVAVLLLVEDGKLALDDKVVPVLGALGPRPQFIKDSRVHDITIKHLLQHSGGFDRGKSGDPLFAPRAVDAAKRQGAPMPPTCETILRDTLEGELDFAPGGKFAYSNVGYCILGRLIERSSGVTYEAFIRSRILEPIGVTRMRPGRTLQKAPGEVTYYDYPDAPLVKPMPGLGLTQPVAAPYGLYSLEAMDSLGQWIGSPVDFLRFMMAIDDQRGPTLLSSASLRQMRARPDIPGAEDIAVYYGFGVNVRRANWGDNWWHGGSQPGVSTLAVRYANGNAWVVAFNMRPRQLGEFSAEVDKALINAGAQVGRGWQNGELRLD